MARETEGSSGSDTLKEAQLKLVPTEQCRKAHEQVENLRIDERNLCAATPSGGVGPCQGDSGGPLMAQNVGGDPRFHLLGVVSISVGCARPEFPAVFSRTERFLTWIRSNLQ